MLIQYVLTITLIDLFVLELYCSLTVLFTAVALHHCHDLDL